MSAPNMVRARNGRWVNKPADDLEGRTYRSDGFIVIQGTRPWCTRHKRFVPDGLAECVLCRADDYEESQRILPGVFGE